MDKALVFGTKDCRLESCQGQSFLFWNVCHCLLCHFRIYTHKFGAFIRSMLSEGRPILASAVAVFLKLYLAHETFAHPTHPALCLPRPHPYLGPSIPFLEKNLDIQPHWWFRRNREIETNRITNRSNQHCSISYGFVILCISYLSLRFMTVVKWSHPGLNRRPFGYWPNALAN